jgi:hypothetical protein
MKVYTMFVIGKLNMEADAVSIRIHGEGSLGAKPRAEVITRMLGAIQERRDLDPDARGQVFLH